MHNVSNIWHVPLIMSQQGAHRTLMDALKLRPRAPLDLSAFRGLATRWDTLRRPLRIAMVGKYTGLSDAYLSVIKALQHASVAVSRRLDLVFVEAGDLEGGGEWEGGGEGPAAPPADADDDDVGQSPPTPGLPDPPAAGIAPGATLLSRPNEGPSRAERHRRAWATLRSADGILVPGGFGSRGVEGKVLACRLARERRVPFLGICLGMQVAVIEFARNVQGRKDAHSTEFSPSTPDPVVVFMPEGSTTHLGGTMRLGSRTTILHDPYCTSAKLYAARGATSRGGLARLAGEGLAAGDGAGAGNRVDERHRHRYEVNPDVVEGMEAAGLRFVGRDETGQRMEIVELTKDDWTPERGAAVEAALARDAAALARDAEAAEAGSSAAEATEGSGRAPTCPERHPYYVACQFHPEFKSRPTRPSPPFLGLCLAASGQLSNYYTSGAPTPPGSKSATPMGSPLKGL